MIRASLLAVLALAALPLSSPACANDVPADVQIASGPMGKALDADLRTFAKTGFGGAVLIEKKGVMVLNAGYGYANREQKIPFTTNTIAQIGSITKPFTAMAILQLVEAGKLDLQKPVKTYLPRAAEPAASATLHQLLTHTAGLADYCGDDFDRLTRDEVLSKCMAMPLAHARGSYQYSDTGFSILAAVVETVSGEPWEAYLARHIFTPLGMTRTGFAHFGSAKKSDFATGYLDGKSQGVISDHIAALNGAAWNLKGNGGIQASAMDMEKFYRGLVGRKPGISRAIFRNMTTRQEPEDDDRTIWVSYGFAMRIDAHGKIYRIGHSGSDGTFFSYFGWLPQQDTFFYIVGNNGEKSILPVVRKIVHAVQDDAGVPAK